MVQHPDPRQNRILAALPLDAYLHLGPFFEPIELKLGDSLAEPGTRMSYAYFPTDSIVSLGFVRKVESANVVDAEAA